MNDYIDYINERLEELDQERIEAAQEQFANSYTVKPTQAAAPRIDEGNLRDMLIDDGETYIIQRYQFGVWKTVLFAPVDPDFVAELQDFIDNSELVAVLEEQTRSQYSWTFDDELAAIVVKTNQGVTEALMNIEFVLDEHELPVQPYSSWPFPQTLEEQKDEPTPERHSFYVDVDKMPPQHAKKYLEQIDQMRKDAKDRARHAAERAAKGHGLVKEIKR